MNKKTAFTLIAAIVLSMTMSLSLTGCPTPASNDSSSSGPGLSATFVETTVPTDSVKGVYTITINGTAARDCTIRMKYNSSISGVGNIDETYLLNKGVSAADIAGGIVYQADTYFPVFVVTTPSANSVLLTAKDPGTGSRLTNMSITFN